MKKAIIILLVSLLFGNIVYAEEKSYRILNSFSAGQLSELLSAREDLSKYHSGCLQMENMLPLPQGGAEKRPGTKYVAESKNNTKIRLIPFEYSTKQSYVVELGNQYARFFTNNAAVTTGLGTESLTGPPDISGDAIAHWFLNEDTTNTHVDDAIEAHDGIATANTDTLSKDGKVGTGCFNLNAQYAVEIADNAALSFDDSGSNPFSVTGWVYVSDTASTQVIFSKWKAATAREYRLRLNSDRKLQFHLCDDSKDLGTARVAHWKMNENAASTAVDDDVSVVPHDGVATANTNVLHATGKTGTGCFDLDTQYAVVVGDHAALSFDDSSGECLSIAAWVYVANTGNQQHIINKSKLGEREWYLYYTATNKLDFKIFDETTDGQVYVMANDSTSEGWHHVVAVYDSADASWTGATAANFMTIYVDGSPIAVTATNDAAHVRLRDTTADVHIGRDGQTSALYWADKVDNIAIFNKALSATEVLLLYNSGNGTEDLEGTFPYAETDDALSVGWHHIAATYDSTGGSTAANGITLYVDGAAVDSTATNESTYVAMENTATKARIGAQYSSAGAIEYVLEDKIDEVVLFDVELSAAQVSSLCSTKTYEIATPYLTADLFDLKYEQSADILYITHPDYEIRKLSRLGNDVWALTAIGIEDGPFRTQNVDAAATIAASATTGTVILTASGCAPFVAGTTAGHLPSGSAATSKSQTGALFRLTHPLAATAITAQTLTDKYGAGGSTVENTSWMDLGTVFKDATWTLVTTGTWTGTFEIQRNYTIGAAHDAAGWEKVLQYKSADDRNVDTTGTESIDAASYRAILTNSGDNAESCTVNFSTDQYSQDGIVEITAVASATSATATVLTTLGSTDATHKWSEGSWSNYRGWPRTVTFFEDRLCFGGNAAQPDTIWTSATADYENMLEGTDDDEALLFTLSSRQVNVIEWLIGKDKILIGTSGAEWTLTGSSDEPLTPSNVKAEQHSTYGSGNLQAIQAGEAVLFFQRGAEKMRELAYNWELDSYVAPDMTILNPEITGGGIEDTGFQQIPNTILWCIREDGEIVTFVYERKELITSWSEQITDGSFESIAVIHGTNEDEVWVSVSRTIGGSTKRYIEYFSARDFGTDIDDAFFVDSGITYDSTATTTITGLSHLEGETVTVLGDGAVLGDETVSGGQITIDSSCSTVQVGLPITVQLKTMPLSWIASGMTIQGRIKRINEATARYYNSGDFYIGRDVDNKELISIDGMDTDEQRITFPAGYDRPGYVLVYQQSPEPLTLLALMIEFFVY